MASIDEVLSANLTPLQRAAASDPAPEVLCLACAGSGKSRTLAFRIARLVAEADDPSEAAASIVAFTFTEKAAEAIKRRVASALEAAELDPTLLGRMYLGTMHGYCHAILGEIDARYRQFDVLDENRLKLYLMSRYGELNVAPLRAERSAGRAKQIPYFVTIREVANAWTTLNDELGDLDALHGMSPTLGLVLRNLRAGLDHDQFVDFSLMIRLVVEALASGDEGALRATAHLKHLMVDEYQDVNPLQEELISQLHRQSESLFVVGDDDQAIYAWRGADVQNILTFQARYPNCASHTLSHNFRSTRAIVEAADGLAALQLGPQRMPKDPTADEPSPRDFRVLWFLDRPDEANWVVDRIRSLLGTRYREAEPDGSTRDRGLTPGDFAILMQSVRGEERDGSTRHSAFTQALSAAGLRFTLEAGGGLFERPEVILLRDTFELLRNRPPNRNEVQAHFHDRVVSLFPHADFDRLAEVLAEWGRNVHQPAAGGASRRVYPQRLVHDLLEAFGVAQGTQDPDVMLDLGMFSRIMQDVESVYLSIDSRERFSSILNFLSNVAEAGYSAGRDEILRSPDDVTVSTIHKAKGLEFPVVFLVDAENGRLPRANSQYQGWLPAPFLQAAIARGAYRVSRAEEARLFYTAVTRAERYLYVSGSEMLPGGRRARRSSDFSASLSHAELLDDPAGLPQPLEPHEEIPRVDERVVPTTYSDIRYYLRCPADYRYRKVYGFSPPITEMFGYGMTVHSSVGLVHQHFPGGAPTSAEAATLARTNFHLKHIPPSSDPQERPGGYERARDAAATVLGNYVSTYSEDFSRQRQVEARFEIPAQQTVIAGSIDLLLREDQDGNVLDATVIDFKTMEGGPDPEDNEQLHWTELALQVQLYAKAAREVLAENARTGHVHLLRDNRRVDVPVDDAAVDAAVANVEWAVDRILAGEFPMRPETAKCDACDFKSLCPRTPEDFGVNAAPPPLGLPGDRTRMSRCFSEFVPGVSR
ncbi:MAG: ATP-dependent DNA helicase [Gemmatimonadetes bacterium]|nr:ATP-dependent DNA helicase [Gemmatimonadota bacterium]